MKTELLSMSSAELRVWMKEQGESAFRGGQVYEWLLKGAEFSEMRNIPGTLRAKLEEIAIGNGVKIRECFMSKLDGTEKYLYELPDGHLIEGVLMKYKYGYTLCVSTQVGCRMGCAFCASTLQGKLRDLTAGEILGQIVAADKKLGDSGKVGNVVLMGSGEPFDNYDNVVKFLRLYSDPAGMNRSLRSVSLSTCGLVPMIDRFREEGLAVTLSLSLHAPTDEIRKTIMPVAKAYTVEETIAACRRYVRDTGRRLIVEYSLINGVNDSAECARLLAAKLRGFQCHVNVIPLNGVSERNLSAPGADGINSFLKTLEECHISATRRREMGTDIQGACGQLRARYLEDAKQN